MRFEHEFTAEQSQLLRDIGMMSTRSGSEYFGSVPGQLETMASQMKESRDRQRREHDERMAETE